MRRPSPIAKPVEEPGCRMARLAGFIVRTTAVMDEMGDDEADILSAETLAPAWSDFWQKTPATTSMEGAVAALKTMLLSDTIDDGDERVLRSVLAFIDAGANEERV